MEIQNMEIQNIQHEARLNQEIQDCAQVMSSQYDGLRAHAKQSNDFTRECLKTAMLQIAGEKNYKEVSITELCKRAGVSRMAFYRNYQIVNDVLQEIANDLNDEVVRTIGSPFRVKTTREWYIGVFKLMAKHHFAMQTMITEEFQYEWMKTVNGYAVHRTDYSPEERYLRLMWCGGFENCLSYWLSSGMKESPEEMADYCITYLPHTLNEKNKPKD